MKNLFNDIDESEKDRILEMHKKKGYNTINEQPNEVGFDITQFNKPGGKPTNSNAITPNQNNALNAGYGVISKEDAEKLAITTKNFTIKPAGQQPQTQAQVQQKPVGQQPQTQSQVQQKKPGTRTPTNWKPAPLASDVQSGKVPITRLMKGDSVIEIQKLLNAGGAKLNPDGKFGTNTYNALIAFQKKSGTTNQKGIVDADTYNKLKGGGKVQNDVQNDDDFNVDYNPSNNNLGPSDYVQPKNNGVATDSGSEFVV
jgi:hypothetical protein